MTEPVATLPKSKLNDAELANFDNLKAAAAPVFQFLSGDAPDPAGKKQRVYLAEYELWLQAGSLAARPFLKANGGAFPHEFRPLWHEAIKCNQQSINIARQWLDEQFHFSQPQGVANVPEPDATITEQSAADHSQERTEDSPDSVAVGEVPGDQVPNHRRSRRRNRDSDSGPVEVAE